MTEQLQHAFEIAQRLPDAAQNTLAAYILTEIEKQGWDKIVSKPQAHLRESALQVLQASDADEPEAAEFDCL